MSGQLAFSHSKKLKPWDLVWGLRKLECLSMLRRDPKKIWYRVKL